VNSGIVIIYSIGRIVIKTVLCMMLIHLPLLTVSVICFWPKYDALQLVLG